MCSSDLAAVESLSSLTENDLLIAAPPPGSANGVVMYAGAGDDTVTGTTYGDDIYGGNQNDILNGLDGTDYLYGESGNDSLFGGNSFDNLFGGLQNDVLFGGNQADRIAGDDGTDRLFGGAGGDYMAGGTGRDQLNGEAGSDDLKGGAGADRFIFKAQMGRDSVRDFSATDHDVLQIARTLAGGASATAASVITNFASLTAVGAQIDFGGGDVIILHGVTDLASVQAAIVLF